jgi:hypothetical protein
MYRLLIFGGAMLTLAEKYMYISNGQYDHGCINFGVHIDVCFTDTFAEGGGYESVGEVYAAACQSPAYWHLADVSGTPVRPPYLYRYDEPQPAVPVYVLDTWVDIHHPEFEKRAQLGASFATGNTNPHGTHVAALVGGKSVGINRKSQIVSVQVLNDNNYGTWETVLRGLDWVSKNPKGVINLSISGSPSSILDTVLTKMSNNGWKIVAASGNKNTDACLSSPSRVKEVLTVSSLNKVSEKSLFSNYGNCVDLYAPGEEIISAYPGGRYAYMSGTSMAAPIVAGILSLGVRNFTLPGGVIGIPRQTRSNKKAIIRSRAVCFEPLILQE